MDDKRAVKLLKRGDERALEAVIRAYTGYVTAVIANQLGSFCDVSTVEELAADVFTSLWRSRDRLESTHLRGWLGATARNCARGYLRAMGTPEVSLDEDCIIIEDDVFEALERSNAIEQALAMLKPQGREIIIRYYYYNQTIKRLAAEMGLNPETAKSSLRRARDKLRIILEKGGYFP